MRIIDALEDSDDVQNVYANFDASDEVLAEHQLAAPVRTRSGTPRRPAKGAATLVANGQRVAVANVRGTT